MDERDRTDLPHDQVARDNDGEQSYTDLEGSGRQEDNDLVDNPYRGGLFETEFLNGKGYVDPKPEDYQEESAAEIAPGLNIANRETDDREGLANEDQIRNIEEMETQEEGNTALGWTALVLSIVSLFFLPVLAGTIGVVTGFFAARNGARSLGTWAIAIGLFSIVLNLFIAPFFR